MQEAKDEGPDFGGKVETMTVRFVGTRGSRLLCLD